MESAEVEHRALPYSARLYLALYEDTRDYKVAKEAIYRVYILSTAQALLDSLPAVNEPKKLSKHLLSFIQLTKEMSPREETSANTTEVYLSSRARCIKEMQKTNTNSAEAYKASLVPKLKELVKLWSGMRESICPIKNHITGKESK